MGPNFASSLANIRAQFSADSINSLMNLMSLPVRIIALVCEFRSKSHRNIRLDSCDVRRSLSPLSSRSVSNYSDKKQEQVEMNIKAICFSSTSDDFRTTQNYNPA
jgi:hypothetical protein